MYTRGLITETRSSWNSPGNARDWSVRMPRAGPALKSRPRTTGSRRNGRTVGAVLEDWPGVLPDLYEVLSIFRNQPLRPFAAQLPLGVMGEPGPAHQRTSGIPNSEVRLRCCGQVLNEADSGSLKLSCPPELETFEGFLKPVDRAVRYAPDP